MKNALLFCATLILSQFAMAQENNSEPKNKKIEIIKIIDGDTVLHEVKMMDGKQAKHHQMKWQHKHNDRGQSFENEAAFEDIDVYISMDGKHKESMIMKMKHHEIDVDSIIKSLESNEDLLVDFDREHKKIKVIKIEIDEEDGDDVAIVEMKEHPKKGGREDRMVQRERKGDGDRLKVFPNPSKDAFNIDVRTTEPNTKVLAQDQNGETIFEKVYPEPGRYTENIKLKKNSRSMVIVSMTSESSAITKKLIVE